MFRIEKWYLSALVVLAFVSNFSLSAEKNQLKIDPYSKEIKTLTERAKKEKLAIQEVKSEINTLKFKKMLILKQVQVEKMYSELVVTKPKKERKVLIYSRTTGFRHTSIEAGAVMLKSLGERTGAFRLIHTEDESMINDTELAAYDAIVMLNCTGQPIQSKEARAAFEKFMASNKGLVGIHAATDCHSDWPNYLEAMGGIFAGHPWTSGSLVTLNNEEPDHICSSMVPQGYKIRDEIYQFRHDEYFSRDKMRVLLSLDLSGEKMMRGGMNRKDDDYAVSWLRNFTGSRVFYTNLGHNEATYIDPVAVQHILTGLQYVMGDIDADSTPSAKLGKFPKEVK